MINNCLTISINRRPSETQLYSRSPSSPSHSRYACGHRNSTTTQQSREGWPDQQGTKSMERHTKQSIIISLVSFFPSHVVFSSLLFFSCFFLPFSLILSPFPRFFSCFSTSLSGKDERKHKPRCLLLLTSSLSRFFVLLVSLAHLLHHPAS